MTLRLRTIFVVAMAMSTLTVAARQATGTLSGVVVTDERGSAPVPRAVVTISGGGLLFERSVVTDGSGRFSFTDLPAGRFALTASKPAYVTSAYGATRPGRPGTAVTLAAGQTANITLQLVRGA